MPFLRATHVERLGLLLLHEWELFVNRAERAKALLELITEEQVCGNCDGDVWLDWHDGGEEKALAAIEKAFEIECVDYVQCAPIPTSKRFRIVETDNFGGDDPAEHFLGLVSAEDGCNPITFSENEAKQFTELLNRLLSGPGERRFWTAVPANSYELRPGFKP